MIIYLSRQSFDRIFLLQFSLDLKEIFKRSYRLGEKIMLYNLSQFNGVYKNGSPYILPSRINIAATCIQYACNFILNFSFELQHNTLTKITQILLLTGNFRSS